MDIITARKEAICSDCKKTIPKGDRKYLGKRDHYCLSCGYILNQRIRIKRGQRENNYIK